MKTFDFEKFQQVDLKNCADFRDLLRKAECCTCESNLLNIATWGVVYDTRYQIWNNMPLVYLKEEDELLFPGESCAPEHLLEISNAMRALGKSGIIHQVPRHFVNAHPELERFYKIEQYSEDFGEYIYRVEDLCELHGSKLGKKKNLIAQFKRNYPDYRSKPFEKEDVENCRALSLRWAEEKTHDPSEEKPDTVLEEEEALAFTFDHFDDLKPEGRCVYVENRLVAYSVFTPINSNMYDEHYEKADHAFKGAGQLINQETALALRGKCEYLNREQDLGIEGLRHAKNSYAPCELLRNFYLTPKGLQ